VGKTVFNARLAVTVDLR